MTEVKNRGWVKNVAIVFLAVMLLLTFFSNTIMNRSLPEVSARYATAGSISTQIRGSGTITAVETYEVKSTDSRRVRSVLVRVGQEVAPGDTLVVLAEGDSSELEAARDTLRNLQYQYQEALINAGSSSENGESLAIARARERLESAIKQRDAAAGVTDEMIAAANANYISAKATYDEANARLTAAGGDTGSGSGGGSYSGVSNAQTALTNAKTALDAVKIQHQALYDVMQRIAQYEHSRSNAYSVEAYMQSLFTRYSDAPAASGQLSTAAPDNLTSAHSVTENADGTVDIVFTNGGDTYTFSQKDLAEAYEAMTEAQSAVDSAQTAYDDAVNSYYSSFTPDNSVLVRRVNEAKSLMDAAESTLNNLRAKQEEYDTATETVISCQQTLEELVKSEQLLDLSMQRMRDELADAAAEVNRLSGESGAGGEITSEVYGVVTAIGVTAGNNTDPNTAIITIEVPDRGYSVSMTVTTEQSRRVTVGDEASVTTGGWGSSGLTGRLSSIRTDPQNPSTNRLLVFDVTGDNVVAGTQVTVSVGQRSQNYDVVVPNSAIREDSNGKYVLAVMARSSPLGNRYVATRIDVQVLASDDTNSAVSGGLANGDFVITNSTRPVEPGMQVRIAES